MNRIKRGNTASKRRKVYLKLAKGYRGANSKLSTMAQEQIIQSLNYSYISRRLKKRIFRKYWIYKINSFLRIKKKNYSIFIGLLKKSLIFLNRKILSYLTFFDPIAIDLLYKTIVMKC